MPSPAAAPTQPEAMACAPKNPAVAITKPIRTRTTFPARVIATPAIMVAIEPSSTGLRPNRVASAPALAEAQVPDR